MATGGTDEVTALPIPEKLLIPEKLMIPEKVMEFYKYLQRKLPDIRKDMKHERSFSNEIQRRFSHQIGWDGLYWYRDAGPSRKVQLRDFLIELDRQNRVNPQKDRTKIIHKGVHQIMTALADRIEQIQPTLGGKLFGVGSSHNGTKVGKPDEFDFIYELNARTLLDDKRASTSAVMDDFDLEIQVSEPDKFEPYDSKSTDKFQVTSRFKYLVKDTMGEANRLIFNPEHISLAFFVVLNEALQHLDLPKGWSHGGFDRPRFSGVRLRYPSFLIQLYYDGTWKCGDKPISVSVDFVPVLKVDHQHQQTIRQTGVLEDHLRNLDGADWVHLFYQDTDPPLTWHEEQLLSVYPFESVAKTVIRVLKVLCQEARCSVPLYIATASSKRLYLSKQNPRYADNRKRDPIDWSLEGVKDDFWEVGNGNVFIGVGGHVNSSYINNSFDETLLTGQDIGENLGNHDILSSYEIKLTVMTLIALDPNKGKSWTSDDIVDLVLSACLVLKHNFRGTSSDYKLNVSVPLERYYKTPHDREKRSTARTFQGPPKLLNELSDALRCGNCYKLGSRVRKYAKCDRINGILEILRSACYGKSTANFKIHCFANCRPELFIKKADLKPSKWKRLKMFFQSRT